MRFVLLSMMAGVLAGASAWARPVTVEHVEVQGGPAPTVRLRFSAEPSQPFARTLPSSEGAPARIYIDFAASTLGADARAALRGSGPLVRVRTGQFDSSTARIVLDLTDLVPFEMQTQGRIVTIVLGKGTGSGAVTQGGPPPAAAPKPSTATAASAPPRPPTAPAVVTPSVPAPAASPPPAAPPIARTPARPPPPVQPPPPPLASESMPLVIIDPGHGGRDPGATGLAGAVEKDIVLAVARLLAAKLESQGVAHTVLTRSSDRYLSVEDRLPPADSSASLFVSLHANACIDPTRQGVEVFYGGGAVRPASLEAASPESTRLAQAVARELRTRVGGVRGAPRTAGFGVLARNPLPSVLIEIAYITHPDDAARAQDPAYQDQLTDALLDGILAFLQDNRPRL